MMNVEGMTQKVQTTIAIISADIQHNGNLDTWFEARYLRGNDKNLFDITKQSSKKTTLGGVEAISAVVPGAGGYLDEGIVAIYKNMGYQITLTGAEIKGAKEDYQTVINTFKFTN